MKLSITDFKKRDRQLARDLRRALADARRDGKTVTVTLTTGTTFSNVRALTETGERFCGNATGEGYRPGELARFYVGIVTKIETVDPPAEVDGEEL